MSILILAEHNNKTLSTATLSAVTAASQIGGDIHILVAGSACVEVAKHAAQISGVSKILHADDPAYAWPLAENIAPLIVSLAQNYSHVAAPATSTGKDVLPRAAAMMDSAQISEITQVIAPDTFLRPIYAGNALETVKCTDKTLFITIRQTAFTPAALGGNAVIENIPAQKISERSSFVNVQETKSERPELSSARIVVSGGRGIGSAENFKTLETFADSLGAGVGASRAAVDSGYVPNDYQVGQTGKVVAPDLYIAVGISGAIQHLAGMKDSKVIVAINKDENAPIFDIADYGLVGDWQTILPELQALLSKK